MTAIDQLRATHRRATTAEQLETALRRICDVCTGDDLEGEDLYSALERAVADGCDALDAYEDADGCGNSANNIRPDPTSAPASTFGPSDEGLDLEPTSERLPAPEPLTPDNTRVCSFTGQAVTSCTCTTCRAHRGEAIADPELDLPPSDVGTRRCGLTDQLVTVCTCAQHSNGSAPDSEVSAEDTETRPCKECGKPWPVEGYGMFGRHRSKSCPPCVSERQRRAAAKRNAKRSRQPSDDKEEV